MVEPRHKHGKTYYFMCVEGHKERSHKGGHCRVPGCGKIAFEVSLNGSVENVYGSSRIPEVMLTAEWRDKYLLETIPETEEPRHAFEADFPWGTFVEVSGKYGIVSKAAWHEGYGHLESTHGDNGRQYVPIQFFPKDANGQRFNGYGPDIVRKVTPTSTEQWKMMRGWGA